jgi:hypothetical protein
MLARCGGCEKMHSPINDLTGRLLKKFPGISLEKATADAKELWAMPSFRISYVWTVSPNRYRSHERINPFVAEFFAQGFPRRLGIGTASDQFICTGEQARVLSDDFIVKFDRNGWTRNLDWNPGEIPTGWCLASRLVPDAASLFFVARKVIKTHPGRKHYDERDNHADRFYAKFDPAPTEIECIKLAMATDGLQYLNIAAARAFLGCTCTPHFGNILVTKSGKLISIDHTNAEFKDSEELKKMFHFIGHDSKLLEVLSGVAGLTEKDIRESVAEIPNHPACGSTVGLREYFCLRLSLWKQLHTQLWRR